jgi:hypothetical protein
LFQPLSICSRHVSLSFRLSFTLKDNLISLWRSQAVRSRIQSRLKFIGEANMLRAVRKFFAFRKPTVAADEKHRRHLAWDRACRARGMTAREQADELHVRSAWVRLRRKASEQVLRQPRRFRDILDRVAADEARTLAAIGGGELAATFLRAYEASEPMEILSREAGFVVHAATKGALAVIEEAPGVVPELPAEKLGSRKTRHRQKATAL